MFEVLDCRTNLQSPVHHIPFLIKEGFLIRTQRGRVATDLAYQHLGMESCLPQRKYNPDDNGTLF